MTAVDAMMASPLVVDGSSRREWHGGRATLSNIAPPMLEKLSVADLTRMLEKLSTCEEIDAEIDKRSEDGETLSRAVAMNCWYPRPSNTPDPTFVNIVAGYDSKCNVCVHHPC